MTLGIQNNKDAASGLVLLEWLQGSQGWYSESDGSLCKWGAHELVWVFFETPYFSSPLNSLLQVVRPPLWLSVLWELCASNRLVPGWSSIAQRANVMQQIHYMLKYLLCYCKGHWWQWRLSEIQSWIFPEMVSVTTLLRAVSYKVPGITFPQPMLLEVSVWILCRLMNDLCCIWKRTAAFNFVVCTLTGRRGGQSKKGALI